MGNYMKTSLLCVSLALLLTACDKPEPVSHTDNHTQTQAVQKQENTTPAQTAEPSEHSVVDKAIVSAGEKSELFKKSTQMADIWALQNALQKVGVKPDDGIKWQQRLAQAKSDEEVKAILNEQIAQLTKTVDELEKIKLHDPEVIMIKEGLKNGAKVVLNAQKQFVNMDLSDPNINQKLMPLTSDIMNGGQMIFKANDDFMKLVQSLGFGTNEEAVAYYELYKQQFEQFQSNQ